MSPFLKYGLPASWLLVIVCRGVFGASDQVSRWALGVLTLAVIVVALIVVWDFVEARVLATRRGERVLTNSTMSGLLIAAFIAGFLLRFLVGGDDPDGLVAWAGGTIGVLALGGLIVLGFLRERSRSESPSFYFNPNWKYGLLLTCIVAMVVFAVADSKGTISVAAVLFFWLALIVLVIQVVGRWISVFRRRRPGSGAVVR